MRQLAHVWPSSQKFHTSLCFSCRFERNPCACGLFKAIQRLAKPAKHPELRASSLTNSLKNVTDEQLVHRFTVFSGIIAPPYDRVRKPS
ncbi:hypothetical protein EMIT0P100_20635 [Pseudomonas sp. IT-P100]